MHVALVHIHVSPEHVEPFVAATIRNHDGSVREPGNVRFDVLQSADDPTRFVLVEMFFDAEAAAAHKATPHYLAWRDQVAGWMASPREGHRYLLLAPQSAPHARPEPSA
jgi:(4S)-4-hydroxy-5-phosphonooxypentane-2,3-dione isomerase